MNPFLHVLVASILCGLPCLGATLWVEPHGADTQAGTKEGPLATLDAALRQARELRRLKDPSIADGVRIQLGDGIWFLDRPVFVRPEDSGTPASPTVITAVPGTRPVLSGGVPISGWRKVSANERVPGMPDAARGNVWVAEAPRKGGRTLDFRQLWVNDNKAVRARHPDGEQMERLKGWVPQAREAHIASMLTAELGGVGGLEMIVEQQWEIAVLRVKEIKSAADGVVALTFHEPEARIEFEHPWPQPILPPKGGGAFYLANAIEFLDRPGEWFLSPAEGRIYYWPRENEDPTRVRTVAPTLETLVRIEGTLDHPVEHVRFEGVTFQHSTWLRPSTHGHVPLQAGMYIVDAYKLPKPGTADWHKLENQAWVGRPPAAVELRAAHDVRFERCRFEHLAMNGIDGVNGVRRLTMEGCVVRDAGGSGIFLGDFSGGASEAHLPYNPSDQREVCAEVRIANNVITDCANEDWGALGIAAGYVRDVTIEHNEVFDVSYTAISVGWGWTRTLNVARNNRIHANHLHHYATRLCDTAAVYTLSAQPGTAITGNHIHSVTISPYVDRPEHWFYLYLDEGSSYIRVQDNWTPEERFFANANGPGNIWENNGPGVSEEIRRAAGLEPAFADLLGTVNPETVTSTPVASP